MDSSWSPLDVAYTETQKLSKVAQSMQYLERLEGLLAACDPKDVPASKGKFSRAWFAERIGCPPGTLTTSFRLRNALGRWEIDHEAEMVNTAPQREDDDTNVVRLPRKVSQGRIYRIPVTIAKGVKPLTKTVPTLVWEDGMDEYVADYARHLVFRSHNIPRSVEETVKKLRQFRRFQRSHGVPYEHVNDDFLLAFLGHMESSGRAKAKRRNEVISAVHDFFKWLDGRGVLVNHVQTRPKGEYDLPDDYQFPISSEQVLVSGRHGQSYVKWISTLTGGATHSTHGMRNTPTSEDVLNLGEAVESHERNGVRNKLIMDWAFMTGARVSEIVQIKGSDLPSFDDIQAYLNDSGHIEVTVERKNLGKAILRVPNELAMRTAVYYALDEQRASIIEKHHNGKRPNDGPVFLSEKGGALNTDSITRIFRGFFKQVGITKANIHRLRAKYITQMIEFQLDRYSAGGIEIDTVSNWQDSVLVAACQAMGHSHPMSLLPYLNEILQRRTTLDGRIEPRPVAVRERSMQDLNKQTANYLKTQAGLLDVAKLMNEGRHEDAIAAMFEFQEMVRGML